MAKASKLLHAMASVRRARRDCSGLNANETRPGQICGALAKTTSIISPVIISSGGRGRISKTARALLRDLMARAERDLGTTTRWVAVDHWNTDNPDVHTSCGAKPTTAANLVISRDNHQPRVSRPARKTIVQLELDLARSEAGDFLQALETRVTSGALEPISTAVCDPGGRSRRHRRPAPRKRP